MLPQGCHLPSSKEAHAQVALGPFIVEKVEDVLAVEITHPYLDGIYDWFVGNGHIFCFDGLWPHSIDLYQWIRSTWTKACRALFFSKGFIIIIFDNIVDYHNALSKRPWFWGKIRLFLTPWFPYFDPPLQL